MARTPYQPKRLNVLITKEAYDILVIYQRKNKYKALDTAFNEFLIEKGDKVE